MDGWWLDPQAMRYLASFVQGLTNVEHSFPGLGLAISEAIRAVKSEPDLVSTDRAGYAPGITDEGTQTGPPNNPTVGIQNWQERPTTTDASTQTRPALRWHGSTQTERDLVSTRDASTQTQRVTFATSPPRGPVPRSTARSPSPPQLMIYVATDDELRFQPLRLTTNTASALPPTPEPETVKCELGVIASATGTRPKEPATVLPKKPTIVLPKDRYRREGSLSETPPASYVKRATHEPSGAPSPKVPRTALHTRPRSAPKRHAPARFLGDISLPMPSWHSPYGACWCCHNYGHQHRACPMANEADRLYCYKCGLSGFKCSDCPYCRGEWDQE